MLRRQKGEPSIAFETIIYCRLSELMSATKLAPRTLASISAFHSKGDVEFKMMNRERIPKQIIIQQIDHRSFELVVVGPIALDDNELGVPMPILVKAVSAGSQSSNIKIILHIERPFVPDSPDAVVSKSSRHVIKRRQVLVESTVAFETKVFGLESDLVDTASHHRIVYELTATMLNDKGGIGADPDTKLIFNMKNKEEVPPEFILKQSTKQSCQLVVVGPIDRDRLDQTKYPNAEIAILVQATPEDNPGHSATIKLIYVLEDSNDEAPIFDQNTLEIDLNENAVPADVNAILTVKANDADSSYMGYGNVTYSSGGMKRVLANLTEKDVEDPGSYFALDAKTGRIDVQRKFDREKVAKFIWTIFASDNPTQGKSFKTTGNVTIVIKDVNDNPPKCESKKIVCQLSEDANVGTIIPGCKVNCPDEDRQSDKNEFSTKSKGGSSCPLQVQPEGDVKLVGKLDRETEQRHICIVEIFDTGKPEFKDETEIELTVEDVNDTPPKFKNAGLELRVPDANNTANYTIPEVITIIDEDKNGDDVVITVELLYGSENFTLLLAEPEVSESMRIRRSASSLSGSSPRLEALANNANFQLQLNKPLTAPFPKPTIKACDQDGLCSDPLPLDVAVVGGASPVAAADATIIGVTAALLLLLLLLILVFILFTRMREKQKKKDAIYSIDDEASDIIKYDEEGPGEEDTDAYDPRLLQKPVNGLGGNMNAGMNGGLNGHGPPLDESLQQTCGSYAPTKRISPPPPPTVLDFPVEDFINDRLQDAEKDDLAPPDEILPFEYEGGGSVAGSLSSLNSEDGREGEQDQDFTNLYNWGPQFAKLADMYGGGAGPEDD